MALVRLTTPVPGVTTVTLDRPDRLNTMSAELVAELGAALTSIAADRECRVVVLTGAGRAFCAGLDLHGYDGDDQRVERDGTVLAALDRQREIARLAEQLHRLPQPVIAAVNGPAAGGGLALVCASDIRIAARSAVFAVGFIRAGYSACDIGVSWLLPRIVGAGRAHELMLTGRRFTAEEARTMGLVVDVVADDQLVDRALATAQEILRNPPASVELTKQGMWIALETASFAAAIEFENRQQVITALTADAREATAAFVEKRSPVYTRR
ncbi:MULTISPECIES: enoyl-CoA hydratase/isomerase family protein [unclassified Blastococcus]